ncbi:helix-turn-helix domain-containing protein [Pediococcus pentosaceus]
MSDNKVTNRLAEVRKQQGLTLQDVANALNVSNGTISRYETGQREPNLKTWRILSAFFDVPVQYLQGIADVFSNKKSYRKYLFKLLLSSFEELRDVPISEYEFDALLTPLSDKKNKISDLREQFSRKLLVAFMSIDLNSHFKTPDEYVNCIEQFYLKYEDDLLEYLPHYSYVVKDDPYDKARIFSDAGKFFMSLPAKVALNEEYPDVGNKFLSKFDQFIESFIHNDEQLSKLNSGKLASQKIDKKERKNLSNIIGGLHSLLSTAHTELGASYDTDKDEWYFGKKNKNNHQN